MMPIHLNTYGYCAAGLLVTGYVIFNAILSYAWYFYPGTRVQADVTPKPRSALHWAIVAVNLSMSALGLGYTITGITSGWTPMAWAMPMTWAGWASTLCWLCIAVLWESVIEYWWHRAMHWRWCYRTCHRLHHQHKVPRGFDDLWIHPLEAAGYFCILYSPAWVFPCSAVVFLLYMVLMGITGVLDHCGVSLQVPGVYSTHFHDSHHSHVNINFGFPFDFTDKWWGTYTDPACLPGSSNPAGSDADLPKQKVS